MKVIHCINVDIDGCYIDLVDKDISVLINKNGTAYLDEGESDPNDDDEGDVRFNDVEVEVVGFDVRPDWSDKEDGGKKFGRLTLTFKIGNEIFRDHEIGIFAYYDTLEKVKVLLNDLCQQDPLARNKNRKESAVMRFSFKEEMKKISSEASAHVLATSEWDKLVGTVPSPFQGDIERN